MFVFSQAVFGQITIHVLHPWASNPVLGKKSLRLQCNESWYPGVEMISECNNWYTYTLSSVTRTSNDHFNFAIDTGNSGNNYITCPAAGGQQLIYSNIFSTAPANADEVWIVFSSLTQPPTVSFKPPTKAKILHILNPWDLGVPRVQISSKGGLNLSMKTDAGKCGWFRYEYFGCFDDIKVRIMNSVDSSLCGMNGKGDSTYINLTTTFSTTDTVWITMPTSAGQTVAIQSAFPGTLKDCSDIFLAAYMHDIGVHPDFDRWQALSNLGCVDLANTRGMVEKKLGSNGLPVKRQTTCPLATQFDWFTTKVLSAPYTNETCYNLRLRKNEEGFYFADDSLFYPIDDFKYLDPAGTIINQNNSMMSTDPTAYKEHNNHFTMIISASFEYTKGQTFSFRGDDDVWVFIDSQLVVDLGGIHPPSDGSVKLDTLGLTPGKTYDFKLFYTERNCCGSSFKMVTSLNLRTNSSFFMTPTQIKPGVIRYDMFEKITKSNLGCASGDSVINTQPAVVDFSISGPSIPKATPLPADTSYGGVIINIGSNSILIDTANIKGLDPGEYTVTYTLRADPAQYGAIKFTIKSLPAHHYDILTDSIVLDKKKDAKIDSIVIGMLDSVAQIYAVLRDSTGTYVINASKPVWTSRNPLSASVVQSPTDPSRCIITKTGTGTTWIMVSDPAGKLKPDSVKVVTYVRPLYPISLSAVMLDNNADLIPDTLRIALTDTFKTGQRLDSVEINYRGERYLLTPASVIIRGTTLLVPFASLSGTDGRPAGEVTLYMTVEGDTKSDKRGFTDGVGPALITADVLENDGTQADVLIITFSEPINESSISGKQFLLIKAGTTDTVALTVTRVTSKTNDSMYTVQMALSDPKVAAGDSLRLVPGSKGGTVSDVAKNKPHDLNRSVSVGFKAGAAALAAAWYLDANADGVVDRVAIRFKRKVQLTEIDSLNIQWKLRYYSARPLSAVTVNDSTYIFFLPAIPGLSTQGAMDVSVAYKTIQNVLRSCPAADSAAPVLVDTVFFHPGKPLTATASEQDTIVVTFSEPINPVITGNTPFKLYSIWTSTPYTFPVNAASLTNTGGSSCKIVVSGAVFPAAVRFPRTGDSIWIDPAAEIRDAGLTVQNNAANRRVFLRVLLKPSLKISLSSNPFNPDTSRITSIPGVNEHGVAITIRPLGAMGDISNITEATVVIYDMLGNTVVGTTPFKKNIAENIYYFTWNGLNKNNRKVGTGTYLGVIRIFDRNNPIPAEKIKIGVRR